MVSWAKLPQNDDHSQAAWWLPPPKELPTQDAFLNTTQGGSACEGNATRNCTTYEYTLGRGGPSSCNTERVLEYLSRYGVR